MPKILQIITYIVPARYFIDIMNGLYLRRLDLHHLWPSYLILLIMCLVLANMARMVLKRDGV
jgi:ABC-2 type transport system permease protein